MIAFLLALCLSHAADAPPARGLQVERADVAPDGQVHVVVQLVDRALVDPAAQGRLSASITANTGRVDEVQLTPMVRTGADVTTVLAFDHSGSFRRHHARAVELARTWATHRLPDEAIGLSLFGLAQEDVPFRTDEIDVLADLDALAARSPAQKETRLGEAVRQAVARATAHRPPSTGGLRQVVVFTDGDEESEAWTVDEVVAEARRSAVRVHVVAFPTAGRAALATRLDNLSRLAALTGGTYVQADDEERARAAVAAIPATARDQARIDGQACALPSTGEHLAVQLRRADELVAWVELDLAGPVEGPAALPCPAATAVQVPAGPPVDWSCLCVSLVLPLGLLAFLGTIGWVAWARRRPDLASSTAPPPDPPPPVPAPAAIDPPKPSSQATSQPPPPARLPETHLVVVVGDLQGTRWRFSGPILTFGALADNDVSIDLPQISGRHARFELFPSGDVYVTDLGSSNGTWLGGERLDPGTRVLVPTGASLALSSQLVVVVESSRSQGDG